MSRLISLLAAARRGAKEGQEERNATKGEESSRAEKGRRQGKGVFHKIDVALLSSWIVSHPKGELAKHDRLTAAAVVVKVAKSSGWLH